MNYVQAKTIREQIENMVELSTARLRAFSGTDMIRGTPAYEQARKEFDAATASLITFNKIIDRVYMDEIIAEYGEMLTNSRHAA